MSKNQLPESKMPELPPRTLLGPGPSNAEPRVLRAMMSPVIGYLDPDFMLVLDEVSELLKVVFQTEESVTMALSGTGSAGMEAGINSLLESGDTVILCVCGFFGERMADMAGRIGANLVMLRSDWGKPFPAEMLEAELKKHEQVKLVATVHAETSTGVLQPLGDIARLAQEHDTLFMVDAVTSLGGTEVTVDELGIDYCYSATQKCIGCPPGLSPAALSPKGHEAIRARQQKPASWYLDLGLIANYWGEEHVYHHTAPVRERAQHNVAKATALTDASRAFVHETISDAYHQAELDGRYCSHESRMRCQLAACFATEACAQAVDLVHEVAGTTAFRIGHGIERNHRDATVLRRHAYMSTWQYEDVGKMIFGLPPDFFALLL